MSDADPAEEVDEEGAPGEPKAAKSSLLCKVCKVVFIVPILVYRLLCALGRGLCRVWHCICNCCICRYTRMCCKWFCRTLCCYNPVPFKWDANTARIFANVGLTNAEVIVLARCFAKVDADRSGQIEVMEFCDFLNFELTPFACRVFTLIDADASGELDFPEFVLAVWNYCSFGADRLRRFAFDLYDTDHSGSLDTKEIRFMFEEVYGKQWAQGARATMLCAEIEQLAFTKGTLGAAVEFKIFDEFVRRTPNLLAPAFHLQLKMQTAIGGTKFWASIEKRREAEDAKKLREGKWVDSHVELINMLQNERNASRDAEGGDGADPYDIKPGTQSGAIAYLAAGNAQVAPASRKQRYEVDSSGITAREIFEYQTSKKAQFKVNVHPMLLPKRKPTADEVARRPDSKYVEKAKRRPSQDNAHGPDDDADGAEEENPYLLARRNAKLDAVAVFDDMRLNMGAMSSQLVSDDVTTGALSKRGGQFLMDDELNSCRRKVGHREETRRMREEFAAVLEWQHEMIRSQRVCMARTRDARLGRAVDWEDNDRTDFDPGFHEPKAPFPIDDPG